MSQCKIAELPDRAVIRLSGAGARAFLQGLITNDIGKAAEGSAIHAGLLSPQGKILFDFFILPGHDGYLLDGAKSESEALRQRLAFYRLRAEVKIEEEPALKVAASWGDTAPPKLPPSAHIFADPRLASLGFRLLLPADAKLTELGCAVASERDYHAHRIALGVPEGGRDYAFGDSFPHEALFDQLDGVDFDKGCFVGQEVVSRMQHRGTTRKRIVGVEGETDLPGPGAEILAGDMPIGTLGSVDGKSGLALIRLDRAEDAKAKGAPLRAGAVGVSLRIPKWAHFQIPAAAAS
jgi:folate-binding protein YgfZ